MGSFLSFPRRNDEALPDLRYNEGIRTRNECSKRAGFSTEKVAELLPVSPVSHLNDQERTF